MAKRTITELIDDLDGSPVELTQECVLLELRELVRLRHLRKIGHADASDLLRLLEQLSDLLDEEAAEVGPLLHRSAAVVDELLAPDQVYGCLWSHAGGVPGHVHYVVQPVTAELMNEYEAYGPRLQVAMALLDVHRIAERLGFSGS